MSLLERHCHEDIVLTNSSLVPRPSNDPSDPLNWKKWIKYTAAISYLLFNWVLVSAALSLAPMYPLLGKEFHLDEKQLSFLTGINIITLAFANILLVPLSNIFGRRPVSIVCGYLAMLTNVWQAMAVSHESLLGARACNGVVAAVTESIMVQFIADTFFLHERGFWVSLPSFSLPPR